MGAVLVTGAAGFIGAAVARRMISDGHRVITIDNLTTGRLENIPRGCHVILGDTHDVKTIAQLQDTQFDAIYHIAGQSGGIPSFENPTYDLNANVMSTLLLLEFAKRTGCRQFIYASSMAVYGEPDVLPADEQSGLDPKSFYAIGKVASESYMRLYSEQGVACTALRLNNTYGPGQDLANLSQGMVSIYISQALSLGRIVVRGSMDRVRDFVHIEDVAEAFVLAGRTSTAEHMRIYNVATGVGTTVHSLLELIQSALPAIVPIEISSSTIGDQKEIYCSNNLIARELGWSPRIMPAIGVPKMVEWALSKSRGSARLRANA